MSAPPRFGSGYCSLDDHICLTHRGELVRMPRQTAIALRDALQLAIDIPDRARAMARARIADNLVPDPD